MAYVLKIFLSMIPVAIVGFCFKDYVEELFGSGLLVVGCMLLVTALLLTFAYYAKPRVKEKISFLDAFVIGIAQALSLIHIYQYDFGLDLDFLNYRLGVTFDYYYRYSDKKLMPVGLPGDHTGYGSQ